MAEAQPPAPSGDPWAFAVPGSAGTVAPQFGSRREAREAAGRPSAPARPARRARAAVERAKQSRRPGDRRAITRAVRASEPKRTRRNPLSVLVTMGMVGGLFAVAGLPAYALTGATTEATSEPRQAQSLAVGSDVAALTAARDGFKATTPEQLAQMSRDALRAQYNTEYLASGARALGDDYPWPYELPQYQGGGLSPLNYYYRECVDFVAWRLNRDQGSYAAPYKWVWSNLTPTGGNASQWLYAWQRHGWPVSKTPVVGSVAWFGWSNHVSYVKAVNDDGTVLLEEYNHIPYQYGQRVVPISAVEQFLYPPS